MKYNTLFDSIQQNFQNLFIELSNLFEEQHQLDSNFASKSEVRSLLNQTNSGFCFGNRSLNEELSRSNCLVSGPTSTGKSTRVLLPSIFNLGAAGHSMIIHDNSGELRRGASGFLASQGYHQGILDYSNPETSIGFNPILRANTSQEIEKLSQMLVNSKLGKANKDPFWSIKATSLLSLMIRALKTQEEKYQNLVNLHNLLITLEAKPKAIDYFFARNTDPRLLSDYKAFVASASSKMGQSIIATAVSSVAQAADESIATVSSYDSFDLNSMRDNPSCIWINHPVHDATYYSTLVSIFLEQCFKSMMKESPQYGSKMRSIFFLLDELYSIGNIPSLPVTISTIRKYFGGLLLVLQDAKAQLSELYGNDGMRTIMTNSFTKVFLTGQGLEMSKEISEILGSYHWTDDREVLRTRNLLTPSEIRTMNVDEGIIISGHHKPIKERLIPCYKNPRFKKFLELPPLDFHTSPPKVSLLNLNDYGA